MTKDKPSKETVLKHVKSDLEQSKKVKNTINNKIIEWRNIYDAKPYGNETEGRSQIVMPEARNTVDWFVPNAIKPFMVGSVVAQPVSGNDVQQAENITNLLKYQYERKFDKMRFLRRAFKTMSIEGTVIARTGWDFTEEETSRETLTGLAPEYVQVLAEQVQANEGRIENVKIDDDDGTVSIDVVKSKITHNNPTAEIIKNEDFYIDPQATRLEDARYVIQAIDYTLSDLRKLDKKYEDEGIYENVDDLVVENDKDQSSLGAYRDATNLRDYSQQDTELEDKPRKRITIYEYYGEYDLDGDGITEPIVCTFSGNTILRLAPNPFPDKKPPFVACQFREDSFAFWGHSLVELVSPHQKLKTSLMRTWIDMMATSTNGIKAVPKGSLDALNVRKLREAKIGDFIEYDPNRGAPQLLQQTNIPPSMINMYEMLQQEQENSTGLTKYNQGTDASSLNKTATGITAILGQAQVRMWEVTQMFSDSFIKEMLKKWVAYNKAYLADGTLLRLDDKDVQLTRDDIDGDYDLDINVSMTGASEAKAQSIIQLLQVTAPMMQAGAITPDIAQKLIAKLFESLDFKDIAKELDERARQQQLQQQLASYQQLAGAGGTPTMPSGTPQGQQLQTNNGGAIPQAGQGFPMEQPPRA